MCNCCYHKEPVREVVLYSHALTKTLSESVYDELLGGSKGVCAFSEDHSLLWAFCKAEHTHKRKQS